MAAGPEIFMTRKFGSWHFLFIGGPWDGKELDTGIQVFYPAWKVVELAEWDNATFYTDML